MLIGLLKLDFGQYQSGESAVELVDFPSVAFEIDQVAGFVEHGSLRKLEQLACIGKGYFVFPFSAFGPAIGGFHGEKCAVASQTHSHGGFFSRREVALNDVFGGFGRGEGVGRVGDEEFSFDFLRHCRGEVGRSSDGAGKHHGGQLRRDVRPLGMLCFSASYIAENPGRRGR